MYSPSKAIRSLRYSAGRVPGKTTARKTPMTFERMNTMQEHTHSEPLFTPADGETVPDAGFFGIAAQNVQIIRCQILGKPHHAGQIARMGVGGGVRRH